MMWQKSCEESPYTWSTSTSTTYKPDNFTVKADSIKSGTFTIGADSITIGGVEFKNNGEKLIYNLKDSIKYNYDCSSSITDDKEKKEENDMNVMNFNFGPCGDRAKISHLGIAVQNSNGEWVSYDKDNNAIVNVDLINFGCDNFVYMMPVAIKDVTEGDAIIHNRHVMFVTKARGKTISVIDVTDGEIKKILPTKSMFGFDFITKIVSLVDFSALAANEDNPFGNMLPFLLLNNDNNKGSDVLPLAFMLMNKDGQDGGLFSACTSSVQMMLMAMMMTNGKNGYDIQNLLPLMFLMNENTKTATM